jgi:predicted nucleic acid-binding protein
LSAFADTSALVKLYAPEDGREIIGALDTVTVSELARVEVPSALWSKHRAGALTASQAAVLLRRFEIDFAGAASRPPRYAVAPVDSRLLHYAARLVGPHALAAGDAIQLATAQAVRDADPECRTFACFDDRLREAAAKVGFSLVP